jgi:hypothetical protein
MKSIPAISKKNGLLVPSVLLVLGLALAFHRPLFALFSPAQLELTIQHPPVIMPAVYKVYNNEKALDGKYSLFKMLVTNNSSNAAQNVEVQYEIPNYIEWKTITKIPTILPGQSVVVNCYPAFTDKIVEKTTSSRETVNIRIKGANISDIDNNFSIDMKGRNEFLYSSIPADEIRTAGEYFDNTPLLSCYVTPEDPIIKYFTQKLQEKVLKGEAASVENKEAEGVRFMAGVYAATLASHMVYSGTSGVPAKIDDVSSIIQSIRLPREVLAGKTGLCIELSLLYASIMTAAGMDAVVYMIPGHAYPGFRMNGRYYAIEATGIGGEGLGGSMSVEQAYQTGMKQANEFFKHANAGDDNYRILDVREAIKKGALAMELKDDAFLRQKIDEMGRAFEPEAARVQTTAGNTRASQPDPGGGGGGGNGGGNASATHSFNGVVNFSYPASWNYIDIPAGLLSAFKYDIATPDRTASVEVYDFSGYGVSSPAQAMQTIKQYIGQFGANMQYAAAGDNGNGFTVYTGVASYPNGNVSNLTCAFKQASRGVVGIIVGSLNTAGTRYQANTINIINSLK